jgi:hypothetical protein
MNEGAGGVPKTIQPVEKAVANPAMVPNQVQNAQKRGSRRLNGGQRGAREGIFNTLHRF